MEGCRKNDFCGGAGSKEMLNIVEVLKWSILDYTNKQMKIFHNEPSMLKSIFKLKFSSKFFLVVHYVLSFLAQVHFTETPQQLSRHAIMLSLFSSQCLCSEWGETRPNVKRFSRRVFQLLFAAQYSTELRLNRTCFSNALEEICIFRSFHNFPQNIN